MRIFLPSICFDCTLISDNFFRFLRQVDVIWVIVKLWLTHVIRWICKFRLYINIQRARLFGQIYSSANVFSGFVFSPMFSLRSPFCELSEFFQFSTWYCICVDRYRAVKQKLVSVVKKAIIVQMPMPDYLLCKFTKRTKSNFSLNPSEKLIIDLIVSKCGFILNSDTFLVSYFVFWAYFENYDRKRQNSYSVLFLIICYRFCILIEYHFRKLVTIIIRSKQIYANCRKRYINLQENKKLFSDKCCNENENFMVSFWFFYECFQVSIIRVTVQ